MPGLQEGLLALALACHHVRHGLPVPDAEYGPYEPWVRPLVLLSQDLLIEARAALQLTPSPRLASCRKPSGA